MKHKLSFFAILLMALALPKSVFAYDFSAVAPTGQTLYYNYLNGNVYVTYPHSMSNYWSGYTKPTGALTIPQTVTNNGVTYNVAGIGDRAFYDCGGLTSVTIPSSVSTIYSEAFYGCTGLTSVAIPNGTVYPYAFSGCTGLTSVTISSNVYTITSYAFDGCSSLDTINYNARNCTIGISTNGTYLSAWPTGTVTTLNIGENVSSITEYAFRGLSGLTTVNFNADSCTTMGSSVNPVFFGCTSLTTLNIGNNVKIIPDYAFRGCNGLTGTLTIPNSVIQIGAEAFCNCTALANVVVGNGVSAIRAGTFANCNHMTNLTLGSGLQTISSTAFTGCNAVLRMTVRAAVPPTSDNNPFTSFNTGIPIYVPCGSISAYQNAPYWGFFTNYQGSFYSFSVTSADPSMGYVNIITQPDCNNHQAYFHANAYNGFHFVRWSDGNTTNPRYLVVNADTELTAEFASNVGIDGAEGNEVHVYCNNGRIYVEAAMLTDMPAVEVYDMAGRRVAIVAAGDGSPELPAGVYVVKVGTYTVQKVVVVK